MRAPLTGCLILLKLNGWIVYNKINNKKPTRTHISTQTTQIHSAYMWLFTVASEYIKQDAISFGSYPEPVPYGRMFCGYVANVCVYV